MYYRVLRVDINSTFNYTRVSIGLSKPSIVIETFVMKDIWWLNYILPFYRPANHVLLSVGLEN